jgi:hypothetical protein
MAQMANALDWDGVGSAWEGAEVRLALLRKIPLTELKGNERLEARHLIGNVLRLQNLISEQAKPWMDEVRPLLESFDRFPLTSV